MQPPKNPKDFVTKLYKNQQKYSENVYFDIKNLWIFAHFVA